MRTEEPAPTVTLWENHSRVGFTSQLTPKKLVFTERRAGIAGHLFFLILAALSVVVACWSFFDQLHTPLFLAIGCVAAVAFGGVVAQYSLAGRKTITCDRGKGHLHLFSGKEDWGFPLEGLEQILFLEAAMVPESKDGQRQRRWYVAQATFLLEKSSVAVVRSVFHFADRTAVEDVAEKLADFLKVELTRKDVGELTYPVSGFESMQYVGQQLQKLLREGNHIA